MRIYLNMKLLNSILSFEKETDRQTDQWTETQRVTYLSPEWNVYWATRAAELLFLQSRNLTGGGVGTDDKGRMEICIGPTHFALTPGLSQNLHPHL